MKTARIKPLLRRLQLFLLALTFTTLSIAGQTLAIDKNFFAGNDILFYDPSCAYTGGSTTLAGNGIKEKIWNFLIQNGLNDVQAAGVMGNMEAESGFIPTRFQGDTSFDPWNSVFGHAWGLVQWDGGRRYTAPNKGVLGKLKEKKPELVKYVDNKYNWFKDKTIQAKIPEADLDALLSFELDYLLQESKSRPVTAHGYGDAGNEWNTMKLQKNIEDATVFWHNNFEVSDDSASAVLSNRGGAAKDIYRQFAGKSADLQKVPECVTYGRVIVDDRDPGLLLGQSGDPHAPGQIGQVQMSHRTIAEGTMPWSRSLHSHGDHREALPRSGSARPPSAPPSCA